MLHRVLYPQVHDNGFKKKKKVITFTRIVGEHSRECSVHLGFAVPPHTSLPCESASDLFMPICPYHGSWTKRMSSALLSLSNTCMKAFRRLMLMLAKENLGIGVRSRWAQGRCDGCAQGDERDLHGLIQPPHLLRLGCCVLSPATCLHCLCVCSHLVPDFRGEVFILGDVTGYCRLSIILKALALELFLSHVLVRLG